VMTVVTLLTTVSVTSLSSLRAGRFSSEIAELTQLIDTARLSAMANNTYVWIGFTSVTRNGSAEIDVASVISSSGQITDLASPDRIKALGKPVAIPFLTIDNNPSLTLSPPSSDSSVSDISRSELGGFQQSVGGNSVLFQKIIQFNPRGEASVLTTGASRFIQIGLQATNGAIPSAQDSAVVRISGLSGQVSIFRRGDVANVQ